MVLDGYTSIPIHDAGEPLVDLVSYPFILEPVYFQNGLSPEKRMFLRKSVAEKLRVVSERIQPYRLKIWDAHRTRAVQRAVYERYRSDLQQAHPDWTDEKVRDTVETYVVNGDDPALTLNHVCGSTVDLTLVDEKGNELHMGTGFDHLGPESAPYFFEQDGHDLEAAKNRTFLRDAMFAEGFTIYPTEWWHFDYGNQIWAFQKGEPSALFGEVAPLR